MTSIQLAQILEIQQKLAILADAAKYDASCASSGTVQRNSMGGRGIGSTEGAGICHSYAPDGRCISLLKILLTNHCGATLPAAPNKPSFAHATPVLTRTVVVQ